MSGKSAVSNPDNWVDLHGDTLFAFAFSRLRHRESAEEVVQETFLAGLRNIDQFRNSGAEGAWLMGILKRKVIDFLRAKLNQPADIYDDSLLAALFDSKGHWSRSANTSKMSLDSIDREEFREIFDQCFNGLPKNQAAVFLLKEVQQESGEDVCKVLGITSSNLWVLMHRARLRLAQCIKSRWGQ